MPSDPISGDIALTSSWPRSGWSVRNASMTIGSREAHKFGVLRRPG